MILWQALQDIWFDIKMSMQGQQDIQLLQNSFWKQMMEKGTNIYAAQLLKITAILLKKCVNVMAMKSELTEANHTSFINELGGNQTTKA